MELVVVEVYAAVQLQLVVVEVLEDIELQDMALLHYKVLLYF